jgi:hypothetical protein
LRALVAGSSFCRIAFKLGPSDTIRWKLETLTS